jgi:hypothetical protein
MAVDRPVFTLVVMALTLLTVVGHICVLPTYAHAAPNIAADHHERSVADDRAPDGDGVHTASCKALRPATVVAAGLTRAVVASAILSCRVVARAAEPAPCESPPLYLAHRALLI